MIVWLVKELSIRGRIVVTAIIGAWMIMMLVLTVWYNEVVIREMKREFAELQQEHKMMQAFMERNISNFARTIERNTDQTKENAEIIRERVDGKKP